MDTLGEEIRDNLYNTFGIDVGEGRWWEFLDTKIEPGDDSLYEEEVLEPNDGDGSLGFGDGSCEEPDGSIEPNEGSLYGDGPLEYEDKKLPYPTTPAEVDLVKKNCNLQWIRQHVKKNETEFHGIGLAFRKTLIKELKQYPFGICMASFVRKFYNAHDYYPDYSSFGCKSFAEFALLNGDIFAMQRSPLDSHEAILFSREEGVCENVPVEEHFKTVWNEIVQFLDKDPILDTYIITSKLTEKFGFDAGPGNWSFFSQNIYYDYVIKHYPKTPIIYIPVLEPVPIFTNDEKSKNERKKWPGPKWLLVKVDRNIKETLDYLSKWMQLREQQEDEPKVLNLLDQLHIGIEQGDSKRLEDIVKIPQLFQKLPIPLISTTLQPGMNIMAKLGGCVSLSDFYIIPDNSIPYLKKINSMLSDKCSSEKDVPYLMELRPGMYVAVKGAFYNHPKTWFRAKILNKKISGHNKFEVELIDYGSVSDIDYKNIRHMPQQFRHFPPALAINCRIKLGEQYKDVKDWTDPEKKAFREKLFQKRIVVQLMNLECFKDQPIWEVHVHQVEEVDGHVNVVYPFWGRRIFEQFRQPYVVGAEEQKNAEWEQLDTVNYDF